MTKTLHIPQLFLVYINCYWGWLSCNSHYCCFFHINFHATASSNTGTYLPFITLSQDCKTSPLVLEEHTLSTSANTGPKNQEVQRWTGHGTIMGTTLFLTTHFGKLRWRRKYNTKTYFKYLFEVCEPVFSVVNNVTLLQVHREKKRHDFFGDEHF